MSEGGTLARWAVDSRAVRSPSTPVLMPIGVLTVPMLFSNDMRCHRRRPILTNSYGLRAPRLIQQARMGERCAVVDPDFAVNIVEVHLHGAIGNVELARH